MLFKVEECSWKALVHPCVASRTAIEIRLLTLFGAGFDDWQRASASFSARRPFCSVECCRGGLCPGWVRASLPNEPVLSVMLASCMGLGRSLATVSYKNLRKGLFYLFPPQVVRGRRLLLRSFTRLGGFFLPSDKHIPHLTTHDSTWSIPCMRSVHVPV